MDHVEERCPLSVPERNLRTLIVNILSKVTQSKLLLWKQQSKVRAALEGDKNTRYFHVCANQRHQRNKIQIIEHDGCELRNHEQKAAVLHAFYVNLLGSSRTTSWRFHLEDLYPEEALQLDDLVDSFDRAEIHQAFYHMHANASPSPDGFGPLFFKSTWATTSPALFSLFDSFYSHSSDIERLN